MYKCVPVNECVYVCLYSVYECVPVYECVYCVCMNLYAVLLSEMFVMPSHQLVVLLCFWIKYYNNFIVSYIIFNSFILAMKKENIHTFSIKMKFTTFIFPSSVCKNIFFDKINILFSSSSHDDKPQQVFHVFFNFIFIA